MALKDSSGRRTMMVVAGLFILPVVLAFAALQGDWFNRGVTNHGNLINPVIELSSLHSSDQELPPKWRLIAVLPSNCQSSCEESLYSVNQVFKALGREQDRAGVLVINGADVSVAEDIEHIQSEGIAELASRLSIPAQQGFTMIADPQGNIMLEYNQFGSRDEAIQTGKSMLQDLKKLLKLSRIG